MVPLVHTGVQISMIEKVPQRTGHKHSQFRGSCRENYEILIKIFVPVAIWKEQCLYYVLISAEDLKKEYHIKCCDVHICKSVEMVELSAFEHLISEMKGKAKLKLILFYSYILLNYRRTRGPVHEIPLLGR